MCSDASDLVFETLKKVDDLAYLDTMNEVLLLALEALDNAREEGQHARMGTYLWMAGRCLQTAVEIYENRRALSIGAEPKQGENTA
jgi:hypothetical protein